MRKLQEELLANVYDMTVNFEKGQATLINDVQKIKSQQIIMDEFFFHYRPMSVLLKLPFLQ